MMLAAHTWDIIDLFILVVGLLVGAKLENERHKGKLP